MKNHFILIIILTFIVSCVAIYGFISGGSPFELRRRKFDQTRILKIRSLSSEINQYFNKNNKLPKTLDDIYKNPSNIYGYNQEYYKDPETGEEFEYGPKNNYTYEICAKFSTNPQKESIDVSYGRSRDKFSKYTKGRYCFELTIPDVTNITTKPTPTPLEYTQE